jgi:8-amino-7-oxononanoate synthase
MRDFSSALYLGLTHPGAALPPWSALTFGRPGALEEPPGAVQAAADLARLTGQDAGLLYPSTLHSFHDLFSVIAPGGATLLIDAAAYPVATWGAASARLDGPPCETYPHQDAGAAARRARRAFRAGRRPVILTDGLCPSCGRLAPLPELARAAADHGGQLVVDDTQALGVLGHPMGTAAPLGLGGGGTLAWFGLCGRHITTCCSLAKGFGAPLAVLLGDAATVGRVAREGPARVHCSPPSVAAIAAAAQALRTNATMGDLLRARLARRIAQLRRGLIRLGVRPQSALPLPVQTIALPNADAAQPVLAALDADGIRALATRSCGGGVGLTILLTARHAVHDVERLIDALARAIRQTAFDPARMAVS